MEKATYRQRVSGKSLPFSQFCCKPKTALKIKSVEKKMPASILKSRLIIVNFGIVNIWNPSDNLMKVMGLFFQNPLKSMFKPSAPYLQFISWEIIRKL